MQPTPVFLLGESPWTEEPDWLHPWDHKELDMSKHSTAHDIHYFFVFPGISVGKESTCTAEDPGLIPGLGRSAEEGIAHPLQYSWASLLAQLVKNPPAMQETWVRSLGCEDPLEKGTATHSSILAWRTHPWVHKESNMTEQLSISLVHDEYLTSMANTTFHTLVSSSEKWE